MLARCQFGLVEDGGCGASLTYPIKGMPWRRNIVKSFEFDIDADTRALLFSEVSRIKREHPNECLCIDDLWSDHSEKANGITRDRKLGRLCYTIGILREGLPTFQPYYSLREDSNALLNSALYKIIAKLVEPHEKL
jgi:hypothetical protein